MPTAYLAELRGLGNGPPPENGGSSRKPMPAFADAWKVADMGTDGDAKLSREEIHRGAGRRHHRQRPPTKRLWDQRSRI